MKGFFINEEYELLAYIWDLALFWVLFLAVNRSGQKADYGTLLERKRKVQNLVR